MSDPTISKDQIRIVIEAFYQTAITDIWIGYLFRHIDDFDQHIPRIVSFWEQHLNSTPTDLRFQLHQTHQILNFTSGHLDRWVQIFKETCECHLNASQTTLWMEKVNKIAKTLPTRN